MSAVALAKAELPDTRARAPKRLRREGGRVLRSLWSLALLPIVLPIIARGASELPAEFARKVALIRKAALQGDVGQ